MSVTTTADEKVNAMRKAVQEALTATTDAAQSICIEGCFGSDEFTEEFRREIMQAQGVLYGLRNELGRPRW